MAWVVADRKVLTPYNVGVVKEAPVPVAALILAGLGVVSVLAIAVRKKK